MQKHSMEKEITDTSKGIRTLVVLSLISDALLVVVVLLVMLALVLAPW